MQNDYHLVQQINTTPHTPRTTPASTPEYSEDEEEEEDFQMVPLNDDYWTSQEISERTLCIHEHGLPHRVYAHTHALM